MTAGFDHRSPLVSVNMPVYNGEKFIKQAIDSILNQTYQNFELIIINDGSSDQSVNIINAYTDKRIKLFHNEKNSGLVYTRNKAIKYSTGKYIAILDCDDISNPTRLEKQVLFLERHADYMLVGSWFELIDSDSRITGDICKYNSPEYLIKTELFFGNYFAQSSLMLRKNIFNEFSYTEGYQPAEDYLLWSEIAFKYKVHNIREVLLKYRIHKDSITIQKKEEQTANVKRILGFHLANLGLVNITDEQLNMHFNLTGHPFDKNTKNEDESRLHLWIDLLKKANTKKKIYDRRYFNLKLESCRIHYFNSGFAFRYIIAVMKFILCPSKSMRNNTSRFLFIYRILKRSLQRK